MHRPILALLIAVVMAACLSPVTGDFGVAPRAPVERLIKNVSAYVKENPNDATGHYLLGRIHSLAFALKSATVNAFEGQQGKLPLLDPVQEGTQGEPLKGDALIAHLRESITHYRQAIKLDGKSGLYRLGLAYTLEAGADDAGQVGAPPGDPDESQVLKGAEELKMRKLVQQLAEASTRQAAVKGLREALPVSLPSLVAAREDKNQDVKAAVAGVLKEYWREQAIVQYLAAHRLASATDQTIQQQPIRGLESLVSYEAGNAYLRLVKARGAKAGEAETVPEVEGNIKALDAKPRGAITPIIFSLDREDATLPSLLSGTTARFDLDGDGTVERWPWVKPTTGILVWDDQETQVIKNGWQLFGSVTFFMFWTNGYHALDALDDNRDGELRGEELRGLSVWFDRNGNGISDRGEVVTASRLGIEMLSSRATGNAGDENRSPVNPRGLRMKSGRVLPTYDWVVSPAAD